MRSFAGFLILMGAGSMVLHLIGFEFILMSWVDSWGAATGWIIRGAVLGLGLTMAALGKCSCRAPQGQATQPPNSQA
jgi:hypothetical protein